MAKYKRHAPDENPDELEDLLRWVNEFKINLPWKRWPWFNRLTRLWVRLGPKQRATRVGRVAQTLFGFDRRNLIGFALLVSVAAILYFTGNLDRFLPKEQPSTGTATSQAAKPVPSKSKTGTPAVAAPNGVPATAVPQTGFPSANLQDGPPALLTKALLRFTKVYLQQRATDTPASYAARLRASTPPDVYPSLDKRTLPKGSVVTLGTVAAASIGIVGQPSATRMSVSLPLTLHSSLTNGVTQRSVLSTLSTWQLRGGVWTLVMFNADADTAGH